MIIRRLQNLIVLPFTTSKIFVNSNGFPYTYQSFGRNTIWSEKKKIQIQYCRTLTIREYSSVALHNVISRNNLYDRIHCMPKISFNSNKFENWSIIRYNSNLTLTLPTNSVIHSSEDLPNIFKVLSESAPVEFAQNSWVWLHGTTGLPWWATLIIGTIIIRTATTLPLSVVQIHNAQKLVTAAEEFKDTLHSLHVLAKNNIERKGWTEADAKKWFFLKRKEEWSKLIIEKNCHPAKSVVLILVQVPLWIVVTASLRNLSFMLPYKSEDAFNIYQELSIEGFGWVSNLTATDQYWILPITLGILNLLIIEINLMMKDPNMIKFHHKILINFVRILTIFMIPIAAHNPASVSLYWMASSCYGLFQNLLLISPSFTRLVGLRADIKNPYKLLYGRIQSRLGLMK
ncbi:cytochrome c oxidase assembly protein COX18, mitochondrial [Prorops nasuta]|uniref:cytochrome c oxidase assembly protein COX18, mitochondrial n=1 Tax=Prorops nasuta TaxID=863751 RepID=UPI0034CF7C54